MIGLFTCESALRLIYGSRMFSLFLVARWESKYFDRRKYILIKREKRKKGREKKKEKKDKKRTKESMT